MSDSHSDAGDGVEHRTEHETDPRDVTNDGEIELNLPRVDIKQRERPQEDVWEYRGATASGTTVASHEEISSRYRIVFGKEKSKVMKMGSSVQTELKLGDMEIEETDKYKYLVKSSTIKGT